MCCYNVNLDKAFLNDFGTGTLINQINQILYKNFRKSRFSNTSKVMILKKNFVKNNMLLS